MAKRVVLVTGASRGLGLELCKQYASAGWTVFAACREGASSASLQEIISNAPNPTIIPIELDVCDEESVEALGTALDRTHVACIDVLYNNAGVALGRTSALTGDSNSRFAYDEWELSLKTNVLGWAWQTCSPRHRHAFQTLNPWDLFHLMPYDVASNICLDPRH
jgi:NAD(P)-dependent dehydrogenase (short-subunit alcohol dehydrogenase family)